VAQYCCFTKRGTDTPEASLTLGGGSYGEQDLAFSAGGTWHGMDGFIAGAGPTSWLARGLRPRTHAICSPAIGHRFGDRSDSSADIVFTALYAHDRIYEAGSLPDDWVNIDPRINYTR